MTIHTPGETLDPSRPIHTVGFDYPGSARVEKNAQIIIPEDQPYTKLSIIMDLLLGPFGCPWDQEQTHESLKRYLLEETYEVIDAIDRNDHNALAEELGDLLLQPVFHARLAEISGKFRVDEPLNRICEKLIRRHPHVFGDVAVEGSDEVLKNWDAIKKTEKAVLTSVLAGVPKSMPALARAMEISKRAARAGFEWQDFDGVLDKVREEIDELQEAIHEKDKTEVASELGDLLFTIVNIARWQKVDAEDSLRLMLNRFQSRFEAMESSATKPLGDLSFGEWDELWNEAKISTKENSN
jgi:tetrapyrrole methylase family protein / MazG family protein